MTWIHHPDVIATLAEVGPFVTLEHNNYDNTNEAFKLTYKDLTREYPNF